jgi:hypothetical protein
MKTRPTWTNEKAGSKHEAVVSCGIVDRLAAAPVAGGGHRGHAEKVTAELLT